MLKKYFITDRMEKYRSLVRAERVGFEPTVQFPVHTLSRRASSATPAPFLYKQDYKVTENISNSKENIWQNNKKVTIS